MGVRIDSYKTSSMNNLVIIVVILKILELKGGYFLESKLLNTGAIQLYIRGINYIECFVDISRRNRDSLDQ